MQSRLSVVFAGGGCRTFWSLGLYAGLRSHLPPVLEWSGTSAGAAMAIAAASGVAEDAVESFVALTAANPRNVYPEHLLRGRSVFPHDRIYRAAVRSVLEKGGWESLRRSAPVRLLLAYVKQGHAPVSTCLKALWNLERGKPGREDGTRAPPGLETRVVTAQQAQGISEVVEWVLSASSTPPLTRVCRYEGQPYVDGGLVDNVPVRALSEPARKKWFAFLQRNGHCRTSWDVALPSWAEQPACLAPVLAASLLSEARAATAED